MAWYKLDYIHNNPVKAGIVLRKGKIICMAVQGITLE